MNIFTKDDYRKIQAWLKANSIKDSDLTSVNDTIPEEDTLVLVQKINGILSNVKISIKNLLNSTLSKIIIDTIIANAVKVNNTLTVTASNVKIDNEKGTTLQDVLDYFEGNKLNRHTDDTFDGNLTVKKNITIEGNIKSHNDTITVEADLEATGEITDGQGNMLSDVNSAAKQWSLEYQDPQQDEPTVRAKYVLKDYRGVPKGSVIKIYKDSAITNVYLGTVEDTCNPNTGEVTKHPIHDNNEALSIVYRLDTGKYSLVNVPIKMFTTEAEFDKYRGLGVTSNGQVFIKLASDVESSNYLHFNELGEITADGIETRILRDLGDIITSVAGDDTMWGVYKEHEGTQEASTPNDGSRWGEFKRAEEIREQMADSTYQVFADNWDEQDDDPEDYGPLAVTEASFAYNWKSVTNPNKTGNIEDLVNKVDSLAVGIFYGYYPNKDELPQDITEKGYAYVGTTNPYRIYNFDGSQWKDSGTTIQATSEADEEDITYNENNKLTFKDRNNTDGMGYVILRKNKSFAEQVTKENTIYEIKYDFTINKDTTIPSNCVLKFNGGTINGTNTLILNTTKCFGINGIHCPIKSTYPIRTSLMGIGSEYEQDSATRLSMLVNNKITIIVDTNIICLSPVISNRFRFRLVGDLSVGYSRPAYTIKFPNSDGFVLTSGKEEATTDITFGHCFRNLQIISDGTCINFWPDNHIGVFCENTFENLYLESISKNCIDYGENYTDVYKTAGFNQYFRQIEARALNGICFKNIRANVCIWDHITIYGSKDGGFYNCTGHYKGIIFDQADPNYCIYGWRWANLNDSTARVQFIHCHFESLKQAIAADSTFNGTFVLDNFYANITADWDNPEDGLKYYDHIDLGNSRSIICHDLYMSTQGGNFAKKFYSIKCFDISNIRYLGAPIKIMDRFGYISKESIGSYPIKTESSDYTQLEYGTSFTPIFNNAVFTKLEYTYLTQRPIKESDITFGNYNEFTTPGLLGKSIILTTARTITGYDGYNIPYARSINKVFSFTITNKSDGNIIITHRDSRAYSGRHCFNSFTGNNLILLPGQSAYCIFNGGQNKGAIVSNKYVIDVVYIINSDNNISAGNTRPINPYIGQQFFDTTSGIEKPIWYKGNNIWVDATGADV